MRWLVTGARGLLGTDVAAHLCGRDGEHVAALGRDELLYIGAVVLCYGVARATHTSAFVVAFVAAATMLVPTQHTSEHHERSADLAKGGYQDVPPRPLMPVIATAARRAMAVVTGRRSADTSAEVGRGG